MEDTGFPNHKPVQVHLSLPSLHFTHAQLRRPRQFPECALKSTSTEADDALFAHSWHHFSSEWEEVLHAQNTDALFCIFNKIAEDFLCARGALVTSKSRNPYCGRGSMPDFVKQPAVGVSRPAQVGGSQTTVKERGLRKLARQLEELMRILPAGPSVWPVAVMRLWRKDSLRAASFDLHFSTDSLRECKVEAIKLADGLAKSQEHDALNRWREKIKLDFKHHKRDTFKWLSAVPLSSIFLEKRQYFHCRSV